MEQSKEQLLEKYNDIKIGFLLKTIDRKIIKCYGHISDSQNVPITPEETEETKEWDSLYNRLLSLESEVYSFLDYLSHEEDKTTCDSCGESGPVKGDFDEEGNERGLLCEKCLEILKIWPTKEILERAINHIKED